MTVNVKKWLPKSIKQPVKNLLLRRQLRDAVRAISRLQDGQIPDRRQLSELISGWSNDGYVANLEYLEAVAKSSVQTPGPVLECGSGATTLLLGILCGRRDVEVWSLENSVEWQERVMEALKSIGISSVHVCTSPLIEYGDFVWYDPPLAQMPKEFSLVICDGPPGTTKGGRYGLLPVMGNRLPSGSTILLDDAGRPGEVELIKKWEDEASFETEVIKTQGSEYALMRRLPYT
jgi:Methyltransferase domain